MWDAAHMYVRKINDSPSTTWLPKVDILREAPAQGDTAADRRPPGGSRAMKKRDSYAPMQIEVRFRGGAEASWLITARGRTWRVPGHVCVHDALAAVVF